jgi:sugar lactone lactonase YvrE
MKKNYLSIPSSRTFIISLFLLLSGALPAQMITTIAGGSIGEGQPATSIGMTVYYHLTPYNVMAVDNDENLYIVDNITLRVRKVTASTGIITTVAGNGTSSFSNDGQPATNAGLGTTYSIAVDKSGNIYLGTTGRIRKVDAVTGIINTIAGGSGLGFSGDGGPATAASLQAPSSITVDTAGNIYFTDLQRIRKVTAATGIITTIAGSGAQGYAGDGGPAAQAVFSAPRSITCDAAGNIYLFDNNNNIIRKITAATGIITKVVGATIGVAGFGGDGGPATAAKISFPVQVIADSAGNLYLSDNNRIRKVEAATGIINTIAGIGYGGYTPDGSNAQTARFNIVGDLAISPLGNLYLREENNVVVRKIAASTNILSTVYGNRTFGISNIGGPVSNAQLHLSRIAVDRNRNIYLSDYFNYKIYRIDAATNTISTVAGTGIRGTNNGEGGLATAANISNYGITVDTAGNFYFTESSAIRKVSIATGILTTIAGTGVAGYSGDGGPATAATFGSATDLTFDKVGNLYFTDQQNNVVRKVSAATGIITTVAGNGTRGFSGDGGPATAASMNTPLAVTVDPFGNLYISDNVNNAVRRVDAATGIITTVAGRPPLGGNGGNGGLATRALLHYPDGLATDTAGNVYIADEYNQQVRKITVATGIITAAAGINYAGFNGDSIPANTALLLKPASLCMDTAGSLYIADYTFRIRKLYDTVPAPAPPVTNSPVFTNAITADSPVIVTKAAPNPAKDNVTITLKGNISGHVAVVVTDVYGKPIATQQVTLPPTQDYMINQPLPGLPTGLYYVTIYVNNEKQVHLLMIQ